MGGGVVAAIFSVILGSTQDPGSRAGPFVALGPDFRQDDGWGAGTVILALASVTVSGTSRSAARQRQRIWLLFCSTARPARPPAAAPSSEPTMRERPPSMTLPRMPPPAAPMISPVVPSLRLQ